MKESDEPMRIARLNVTVWAMRYIGFCICLRSCIIIFVQVLEREKREREKEREKKREREREGQVVRDNVRQLGANGRVLCIWLTMAAVHCYNCS